MAVISTLDSDSLPITFPKATLGYVSSKPTLENRLWWLLNPNRGIVNKVSSGDILGDHTELEADPHATAMVGVHNGSVLYGAAMAEGSMSMYHK